MEFITVEQFKEQPIEVQKVFLDWWKPSAGDIFIFTTDEYDNSDCNMGVLASEKQIGITNTSKGEYRTPLFTEGQLRRFIENKTGFKVDCCFYVDKYDVNICEDFGLYIKKYEDIDTDLLEAYWKVACMIAKEEVDG